MGWLIKERRGPTWKQAWSRNTLSSVSAPPMPLLAVFGIVLLLVCLSYYTGFKAQVHRAAINFRLLLFVLPALLLFLVRSVNLDACRWLLRLVCVKIPRLARRSIGRTSGGGSPLAVALLLVVLLVMVSFQSSFHSNWFRPLWRFD